MNLLQATALGIVEGVTEFLPVSSTGHLTITERLLGLPVNDASVTGFTAVIQVGAIAAVLVYFGGDIARLIRVFFRGLRSPVYRGTRDFRYALAVGLGTLPICFVGLTGKKVIEGPLRSLWVVGLALILWSPVMVLAERVVTRRRGEGAVTVADGLIVGTAQVLALIPGVSRSGATISAGLMRGLDRVTATRLSFLLGIPSLLGAGVLEMQDAIPRRFTILLPWIRHAQLIFGGSCVRVVGIRPCRVSLRCAPVLLRGWLLSCLGLTG